MAELGEESSVSLQTAQNEVVGWVGLEPTTNGLKGRCSTD